MNKTAKLIISIVSFFIALVLIVITFFDFIRICGKWDMTDTMGGSYLPDDYKVYMEFCFGGEIKVGVEGSGMSVSDDLIERMVGSYDGMTYKLENGKLSIVGEGLYSEMSGMPYKVTETTLELSNPDPDADPMDDDYTITLDRMGLSLAWIIRIVGGVFLLIGVVFLIIPSKKKASAAPAASAGYAYDTTSYAPATPTYDYAPAAPAAPTYDYTPAAPAAPTYTAPAAPTYDYTPAAPAAPTYTAPAAPTHDYTPAAPAAPTYTAPAAPTYDYAPAAPAAPTYTAPAAPAYDYTPAAPAAPAYTAPTAPSVDAPSYVPSDLPKSVRPSDSDRFTTAGDL